MILSLISIFVLLINKGSSTEGCPHILPSFPRFFSLLNISVKKIKKLQVFDGITWKVVVVIVVWSFKWFFIYFWFCVILILKSLVKFMLRWNYFRSNQTFNFHLRNLNICICKTWYCFNVSYLDHLTALLRCLILARLGRCGDEDTVTEGRRRFQVHIDGTEALNADIRSAVYR